MVCWFISTTKLFVCYLNCSLEFHFSSISFYRLINVFYCSVYFSQINYIKTVFVCSHQGLQYASSIYYILIQIIMFHLLNTLVPQTIYFYSFSSCFFMTVVKYKLLLIFQFAQLISVTVLYCHFLFYIIYIFTLSIKLHFFLNLRIFF